MQALESDFWRPYPSAADFDLSSLHELGPFLPNALPQVPQKEHIRRPDNHQKSPIILAQKSPKLDPKLDPKPETKP